MNATQRLLSPLRFLWLSGQAAPHGRPGRTQTELALPLLLAMPVLLLLHFGGDLAISRWFFDVAAGRFPLSGDWWLKQVLHDGAKRAAFAFACAVFAAAVAAHVWQPLGKHRWMLWRMLGAMLLAAAAISVIKHYSNPACPYQLQAFGGSLPYVEIFEAIPSGYLPGHCWPGGHGSTAFSLFCLYFAARDADRPRLALGLLAFVLLFGLVLSATQVIRGMHFVSHQVWTALICWYLTWLLSRLWRKTVSP